MPSVTEGQLNFHFPDDWNAISYDENGGFYKTVVERSPLDFKAMDILAVSDANTHTWVEVKDCFGNEDENRPRFSGSDSPEVCESKEWIKEKGWEKQVSVKRAKPYLADEVAKKTVDTLTGLICSIKNEDETLTPFCPALSNQPINVVLFLTLNYRPKDYKRLAMRLQDAIRKRLKTLNINQVTVCNEQTIPISFAWTVSRN